VLVQRGALSAADALAATIDAGESLFIFPEGTFVRAPGLMPFRLGAFQIAVERRVPIVPIALRGTRTVWPDETFLLRPSPMAVSVGDPLVPADTGWAATVALRTAARAWIGRESGEPLVARGAVMVDDAPPA
jgi:1-acyl-sn-glycerol-3-phosphate acyltransferase